MASDSNTRHSAIRPKEVSRKFNIWIEKSKYTLRVTTQKRVRHALHILHRIYRFKNILVK